MDAEPPGWYTNAGLDLDASLESADLPLCTPEEQEKLFSLRFPDDRCELPRDSSGRIADSWINDYLDYLGERPVVVEDEKQCEDNPLALYPDDQEQSSKYIACEPLCEGLKWWARETHRGFCEIFAR